jgi:hypothetical protein
MCFFFKKYFFVFLFLFLLRFSSEQSATKLRVQHTEPRMLHALNKEMEVKHMDVQRAVVSVAGTPFQKLVPSACWSIPAQVIKCPHLIQVVTHIRLITVFLKVLYQLCKGRNGSPVIKRPMLPGKHVHCVPTRTCYHRHLVQCLQRIHQMLQYMRGKHKVLAMRRKPDADLYRVNK